MSDDNIIQFPQLHPLKPSDPNALCVGRRVRCGLYGGSEGIVVKIHGIPAPSTVRSLMGVMSMGGHATVDVAFASRGEGHPANLHPRIPESIIYGVQWDIWPTIASPEEIEKLLSEIAANEAHAAAVNERAGRITEDAIRRGEAFLKSRRPIWATHAIVALHQHDDCDSQTDYYSSHTDKTLLLAWSKHGRNLFAEMRKAADGAPETVHLGPKCSQFTLGLRWDHDSSDAEGRARSWLAYNPETYHHRKGEGLSDHMWRDFLPSPHNTHHTAPRFIYESQARAFMDSLPAKGGCEWYLHEEEIEHREDYSGGKGLYLGRRHYSGWQVRKVTLDRCNLALAVGLGGYRIHEKPGTLPLLEAAPDFPLVPSTAAAEPEAKPEATITAMPHRTAPIIPDRLQTTASARSIIAHL